MTEAAGAVIGINLGQSYGSIACINQHGRADVIANEDGERQLATRIAFDGDQVYIGNQATPQLVRNAANVIDRFVNLLGRSFSDLTEDDKKRSSSPVINVDGVPSFRVQINGKDEVLSAHDVAVRYIRSLFLTAKDFLSGTPIAGAVLSSPLDFSPKQMTALKNAASDAGLIVLQLVPAPGAALTAYGLTSPQGDHLPKHPDGDEGQPYLPGAQLDRTIVVVDVGGTSSSVSLLQASAGLYTLLAYDVNPSVGGKTIDDALVDYLAKEFTKKTKIPIESGNARAWAKLRNEAEITKRSLSASNSAQCSIESLAEGADFSMSVNRLRIDLLSKKVWEEVHKLIKGSLQKKGLETAQVDEVILVGGSSRLQGLKDYLSAVFPETTHLTDSVDADQAIARGCAVHAQVIATTSEDSLERSHLVHLPQAKVEDLKELKVPVTSKPVGIVIPAPSSLSSNGSAMNGISAEKENLKRKVIDGKLFVTLLPSKTPLPARRAFNLAASKDGDALLSFFEGDDSVRVDKVERPKDEDEEEEEDEELDEEDEFVEVQTVVTKPVRAIGDVVVKKEAVKEGRVRVEVRAEVGGKFKVLVGEERSLALEV